MHTLRGEREVPGVAGGVESVNVDRRSRVSASLASYLHTCCAWRSRAWQWLEHAPHLRQADLPQPRLAVVHAEREHEIATSIGEIRFISGPMRGIPRKARDELDRLAIGAVLHRTRAELGRGGEQLVRRHGREGVEEVSVPVEVGTLSMHVHDATPWHCAIVA